MATAPEIQIVRNAPPPQIGETRGRKRKTHPGRNSTYTRYPWDELRVGDAFDVPIRTYVAGDDRYPEYNRVSASVSKRNQVAGGPRYVCRMMDDYRVRVWRIA